jgi:outer membrane protein TolC
MNDRSRIMGAEGESWWLMASLKWELFDGMSREYEKSKARFRLAETEEQLQELKKIVSFRVLEAYLGVEEAQKNAELSKAALATAEEGQRLVKSRFNNSLAPLIDLLDVQVSLDGARANVVMKENQYQLAIARLAYESGTIGQDINPDK